MHYIMPYFVIFLTLCGRTKFQCQKVGASENFVLNNGKLGSGKAPWVKLNDGRQMPSLGFGTWLGFENKSKEHLVVEKAVENAIDAGYRLIDTAYIYFTEEQIGHAVHKKMKEGVITRDKVFISSKLWNTHHRKKDVIPALQESLAKLKLSYLDLYLIHFPVALDSNDQFYEADYLETWQAMVEAQEQGLAKSIGVCNFNVHQLERLINNSSVKPAVLQIEVNLNLQQPELLSFAHAHGIQVMAYTPFGALFGTRYRTIEAPPPRSRDPELQDIARKYNKTVAQVTLRYIHELRAIPIPKSTNRNRIEENIDIFDFQLTEDDRGFLKGYDKNFRTITVTNWTNSTYYPFEKDLIN